MKYKRKCWWCKKEFETDDIDLEYCSIQCFHKDEDFYIKETEDKDLN